MQKIVVQFLRYLVVGGVAFAADFGTLTLLHGVFHIHYLVANAGGFIAGLLVNYFLSIRWVFDQRRLRNPWMEFLAFAGIGLLGLLINEASMYLLVDKVELQYQIAKVGATGISLVWNFGARKVMLFQRSEVA